MTTQEARVRCSMFVWSKLSTVKWLDVWEERFASDARLVISRLAGKTTIRVELYCEKKGEAAAAQKQFGGSVRQLKSQNWAALDRELPPPVKVRENLLITAEKSAQGLAALQKDHPQRKLISIPPDMAFGTGHHATTASVLRLLSDFADSRAGKSWTMADLGTGSGVLAIAAEICGATDIWACDFDPKAVEVARHNLKRNRTRRITLEQVDVLKWKPSIRWDCVAANLFSTILEKTFGKIARSVKKDGIILVSGILKTQAEDCLAAGKNAGIEFHKVVTKGKWVSAAGRLATK